MLVAIAMLAGCAGPTRTGATLEAVAKTVGAPKAGQARVVIIRPKELELFDIGWEARLDGAPLGNLKTGTFVYRDCSAGNHQLTFARPGDLFRASHREFAVVSARTYYFRLEMNDKGRMVAAGSGAGLTGLLITSVAAAAQDDRGFFDFVPLDETAARTALADLHLAD
jgi:hypothetical protein